MTFVHEVLDKARKNLSAALKYPSCKFRHLLQPLATILTNFQAHDLKPSCFLADFESTYRGCFFLFAMRKKKHVGSICSRLFLVDDISAVINTGFSPGGFIYISIDDSCRQCKGNDITNDNSASHQPRSPAHGQQRIRQNSQQQCKHY